jgi:hypothetical protein
MRGRCLARSEFISSMATVVHFLQTGYRYVHRKPDSHCGNRVDVHVHLLRAHEASNFHLFTSTAFAPVAAPLHGISPPPLRDGVGISSLSSLFLLNSGIIVAVVIAPTELFVPPMKVTGSS